MFQYAANIHYMFSENYLPLASFAFTKAVIVSKKGLAIETSYFFTALDITQHSNTGGISSRRNKATIGSTI